jgi:3-oxoacyl-[acyl-carrier-protein] synthase II
MLVLGYQQVVRQHAYLRNDFKSFRPMDKDRDGFVLGEGAGALILEEYEHACSWSNYLQIGGGMSADAYHITAPHPDGLGAKM